MKILLLIFILFLTACVDTYWSDFPEYFTLEQQDLTLHYVMEGDYGGYSFGSYSLTTAHAYCNLRLYKSNEYFGEKREAQYFRDLVIEPINMTLVNEYYYMYDPGHVERYETDERVVILYDLVVNDPVAAQLDCNGPVSKDIERGIIQNIYGYVQSPWEPPNFYLYYSEVKPETFEYYTGY